jgi:hypothetical protein
VTVTRGAPRSIVILCPDGCGEVLTVNLDRRSGPAWRFFERRGTLTIYPSIWRDSGCRAHFIIWNSEILWCDGGEAEPAQCSNPELLAAVEEALPPPMQPHRHSESSERGTKFGRSQLRRKPHDRIDVRV